MKIEELRSKLVGIEQERKFNIERSSISEEERTVELSVSSETPVERWFGLEVLDHSQGAIRLGRFKSGAAFRDTHYGDQIGIIEDAWIDTAERKLRIKVRFSKATARAVEIWKDVVDGIRKNVSIRYVIHELVLDKQEGDVKTYRASDWEPVHGSMEADPADPNVGVGRSNNQKVDDKTVPDQVIIPIDGNKDIEPQFDLFNRENKTNIKVIFNKQTGSSSAMTDEEKRKMQDKYDADLADAKKKEATRVRSIHTIAEDFQANVPHIKLKEKAREYVETDKSADEFRAFVMQEFNSDAAKALRTPEGHVDLSDSDIEKYDLGRAILSLAGIDKTFGKLGIEREVHEHLREKLEKFGLAPNGILVPTNVLDKKMAASFKKRNISPDIFGVGLRAEQNVTSAAAGGNTVNEQVIAQSFIQKLQSKSAFLDAGVNFLPGMQGSVPFIRELDDNDFYWVGESTAPTSSGLTFSRESKDPKLGGAKTSVSRQMLLQSAYVNAGYLLNKLVNAATKGLDRVIPYGLGTDNQPYGFKNISGTHGVVGTGFNREKAIDMKSGIKAVDAEIGSTSFICNSNTYGILEKRDNTAGGVGKYLIDEITGKMVQKPVKESNRIDDGDLFYGVWSSIYLLEWGFLDVMVNPYGTGWDSGDIALRVLLAINTHFEHAPAISIAENVD